MKKVNQLIAFIAIIAYSCSNAQQQSDYTVATEPSSQKYTQAEYTEFISDFDRIMDSYTSDKKVYLPDDPGEALRKISFQWQLIYGRFIVSKFDSSNTVFFQKKDSARAALIGYQTKMFPKIRESYKEKANKLLWELDCKAQITGKQNEILILSGNHFLPNKNKKQTYDQLKEILTDYRFKVLRFRWHDHDSDYFDFEIISDNDSDYVSF